MLVLVLALAALAFIVFIPAREGPSPSKLYLTALDLLFLSYGVRHILGARARETPAQSKESNHSMKPTPKVLTHLLPLIRPVGLPIYVARFPAAPFASRLAPFRYKLTHSLPLIRPLACPSMSHRFPRAPFRVFATPPSTSSRFPAYAPASASILLPASWFAAKRRDSLMRLRSR
jgi:hypothetical protein